MFDNIFFSFINKKFIGNFLKGGNKSQAEILSFKFFVLLRQLYLVSVSSAVYQLLRRFLQTLIVRQVRIGARKYAVPQPISATLQLSLSMKRLFVGNVRSAVRLYFFFIISIEAILFNKVSTRF